MNRTAIVALNAVLVIGSCMLAGRMIALVAGEVLLGAPAAAAAPPSPRGQEPERGTSWDDRQVILSRNLFNVSTLAPAAPVPEVDESEEYEETRLPLRLLGTAASPDPDHARAAVEDQQARVHRVVSVGGELLGAEVVRIERRRIVLRNKGRLEELSLDEAQTATARPTATRRSRSSQARRPPRPSQARADVRQLGDNRFSLDRGDVEAAATNPAALFSQARILPKYEDGQMKGVQLNAIKTGSLFEQIGIQDGDVITEVNGIQVNGQQESAEVLRELTQATEFDVTVTGADGNPRELHYQIR